MRYFVLLKNYVTLGLQKHLSLVKSDIRDFFVRSGDGWKVRHDYLTSWFVNLLYLFLRQNYVVNAFLTMAYFSWRYDYVPLWYIALRMEITYGNYVSFLFVTVTYFLFLRNYVIYLFNVLTIFDDVRMPLYFGSFELRMKMTWNYFSCFFVIVTFFLFRYNYVICLFHVVTFLVTLERGTILVRFNYKWK